MTIRTSARIAAALVGAAVLTIGLGIASAPFAGAQDPYGSTTTTAPQAIEATCGLTIPRAEPGTTVTATVRGVFFGERVRILFDGVQVGEGRAPDAVAQSAGAPVAFGGQVQAAPASTTNVLVKFTVPKAAPGTHTITAVGDTFTCFCNPKGEFTVLAKAGNLVKTGVNVALALVVGVALLLVGRVLLSTSHRRRAAERTLEERTLTSSHR
jgi:hypothetical protein